LLFERDDHEDIMKNPMGWWQQAENWWEDKKKTLGLLFESLPPFYLKGIEFLIINIKRKTQQWVIVMQSKKIDYLYPLLPHKPLNVTIWESVSGWITQHRMVL